MPDSLDYLVTPEPGLFPPFWQKKTQAVDKLGLGSKSLAIPYFRMANCHTIIGAKRFHFRVRDGIGWFTFAMVTKQTGGAGFLPTRYTQPYRLGVGNL